MNMPARARMGAGASVPYVGSAAVRFAVEPFAGDLRKRFSELAAAGRVSAWRSRPPRPGRGWSPSDLRTRLGPDGLHGDKVAVEHAGAVEWLAVVAVVSGAPRARPRAGRRLGGRRRAAARLRRHGAARRRAATRRGARGGRRRPARHPAAGAHVRDGRAASRRRAVGAAGALLHDARRYAGERRQFGRTIGSNQALRHLLAQMYVRHASSWSTVLYAAAALDDDLPDAEQTAAVAKAYVARAARVRTARCRSSAASPSPRSTRRIASCAGSSCASSSSATPPTTSARWAGASPTARPHATGQRPARSTPSPVS